MQLLSQEGKKSGEGKKCTKESSRKLLAPACQAANNAPAKEASPAKTPMRHSPSPPMACRTRKSSSHFDLCLIATLFEFSKVSHCVASCRTTTGRRKG